MNDVFPVKFYNFLNRPKNLAPLCLCASAGATPFDSPLHSPFVAFVAFVPFVATSFLKMLPG